MPNLKSLEIKLPNSAIEIAPQSLHQILIELPAAMKKISITILQMNFPIDSPVPIQECSVSFIMFF